MKIKIISYGGQFIDFQGIKSVSKSKIVILKKD